MQLPWTMQGSIQQETSNYTIYWQDKLRSGLKDISKCLWNGLGLLSPSPRAGTFYL